MLDLLTCAREFGWGLARLEHIAFVIEAIRLAFPEVGDGNYMAIPGFMVEEFHLEVDLLPDCSLQLVLIWNTSDIVTGCLREPGDCLVDPTGYGRGSREHMQLNEHVWSDFEGYIALARTVFEDHFAKAGARVG